MDHSEFRSLAITSAKIYWDYLKAHGKGISSTKVSFIKQQGQEVHLYLSGRLSPAGLDSLQLQIFADRYPTEMIKPLAYHSDEGLLILRPHKDILRILPSGTCKNVSVISDLLFLVSRVQRWYELHPGPFDLPASTPTVSPPTLDQMAGGTPSDEQFSAVQCVLSTPFSYVWGAPGTGKTRYVLANCVLAYLREDKKIILLAPTNNALDQMLSGVLDVLYSADISPSRIRRLGIPSREFFGRYPDVCEHRSVEDRRAFLTRQIQALESKLRDIGNRDILTEAISNFSSLHDTLSAASASFQSAHIPAARINHLTNQRNDLLARASHIEQQLTGEEVWQRSFSGLFCRFFLPQKYTLRLNAANDLFSEQERLSRKASAYQREIDACTARNDSALRTYQDALTLAGDQFDEYCRAYGGVLSLPSASVALPELPAFLPALVDDLCARLNALPQLPLGAYDCELSARLKNYQDALAKLEESEESKWSDVRVLAMTIDRYIAASFSSVRPDYSPQHIFMDEAAYCSLIKGYILFSAGCPITLLGDHSQLPPVCEMSQDNFRSSADRPVFLFSQSAIHMESALSRSYDDLYQDYKNAEPPAFHHLFCCALPVTYRFGPNLADVLSEYVYTYGLKSAKTTPLAIYYVNAPASARDPSRTSAAECAAISRLVQGLASQSDDFAVLSPYRAQNQLLSRQLPAAAAAGQILTVHASQGREFDTIVFSVVDTTRKYYVNSSIPIGKAVINTAVSRAKARLILVLDVDYWYTQKNQMIGQLLRLASPYAAADVPHPYQQTGGAASAAPPINDSSGGDPHV